MMAAEINAASERQRICQKTCGSLPEVEGCLFLGAVKALQRAMIIKRQWRQQAGLAENRKDDALVEIALVKSVTPSSFQKYHRGNADDDAGVSTGETVTR